MTRFRLESKDEFMHDTEGVSNFNESMYFNFYDVEETIGGFLRLGNRPNERYAEQTTCIYLPDGRVGFVFQRPEISTNDGFDAGGCSFEVISPFEELAVRYEGKLVLLEANPLEANELASHQALTGRCWTQPTLSNGVLFLRNGNEMVAYDLSSN